MEVYQRAFAAAMKSFHVTKRFPVEKRYSLVGQIRRASRSVCSNLAEGWRKRRYPAAFISKLSDSEGEAAETQTWLEFSEACGYLPHEARAELCEDYDVIIGMLVNMNRNSDDWTLR